MISSLLTMPGPISFFTSWQPCEMVAHFIRLEVFIVMKVLSFLSNCSTFKWFFGWGCLFCAGIPSPGINDAFNFFFSLIKIITIPNVHTAFHS